MIRSKPNVAINSLNQSAAEDRLVVDSSTSGSSNIKCASSVPRHAPANCTAT
jgi:hypothetical protein